MENIMQILFNVSDEMAERLRERTIMSPNDKNNADLLRPHVLDWQVGNNTAQVIATNIRTLNCWVRPTVPGEVLTQHTVLSGMGKTVVTVEYIVDDIGSCYISVLKEYPNDCVKPVMCIDYNGDRHLFINILQRQGILKEHFKEVIEYKHQDGVAVQPWQDRNSYVLYEYSIGSTRPLINELLRIFQTGFKYAWAEEDDALVCHCMENEMSVEVNALIKARNIYINQVHALADELLKPLTKSKSE
jgi:hypothetical protein